MQKPPVYFSVDIESDGPSPAHNSMLQLGIAVLDNSGAILRGVRINIRRREDGKADADTQRFWANQPERWRAMTEGIPGDPSTAPKSPEEAMSIVANLLREFSGTYKIEWVAKPKSFDWTYVNYYYHRWAPANAPKLGHKCHCLSESLQATASVLGTTKDALEEHIVDVHGIPSGNVHDALDDAVKQGLTYVYLIDLQAAVHEHMRASVMASDAWRFAATAAKDAARRSGQNTAE